MIKYFENLFCEERAMLLKRIDLCLNNQEKMFIVTANPEIFMTGGSDPQVDALLCDPKVTIIADGIGIVKGAEKLGFCVKERIPGVELTEELLKKADKERLNVYFFGATATILQALLKVVKDKYPDINVCGYSDGYANDKDAVFEEIKVLKPDIVLVALGVPAQEKLIYKHLDGFDKGIFVGVGGSFDVLSGTKARAPQFFIKHNLEWLYRIIKEPKRLKRFYNNNVKFLFALNKK